MDFSEKAELVYRVYQKTLDFNLACDKLNLTPQERKALTEDESFQFRLRLVDIEIKEEIITSLRELAMSENESIRLRATESLGQKIYSERFVEKKESKPDVDHNLKIVLTGEGPSTEKPASSVVRKRKKRRLTS